MDEVVEEISQGEEDSAASDYIRRVPENLISKAFSMPRKMTQGKTITHNFIAKKMKSTAHLNSSAF